MTTRLKEGDPVRVTDQVRRREATGHVVDFEMVEYFNRATRRSSRRQWVRVRLENGTVQTYTRAQVKKLRRRKA